MYQKSTVCRVTKTVVDVMFYSGILCLIAVPFLATAIKDFYGYGNDVLLFFFVLLFLSGVCAVYILFQLKQMFKTLLGENPFVKKNITCFQKMAIACACIALIYIVKCFLLFTWATLVIAIVFFIGFLFCLTLKEIFKQAICYKEEHDWTV